MPKFQVVVSVALHIEAQTEELARNIAVSKVEDRIPESISTEIECSERMKR